MSLWLPGSVALNCVNNYYSDSLSEYGVFTERGRTNKGGVGIFVGVVVFTEKTLRSVGPHCICVATGPVTSIGSVRSIGAINQLLLRVVPEDSGDSLEAGLYHRHCGEGRTGAAASLHSM